MLTIGFSPCPNDTFIFHGLVHGLTGADCPLFAEPLLADVETLNGWAMEQARLDVTKVSYHALGHMLDEYVLLRAGSALGRGCGPLLVSRGPLAARDLAGKRIAIPGRYTTAAMLLALFSRAPYEPVVMPFEQIMPCVARGTVDCGVIIHESRFTFQQHGLLCLQDLGAWWEAETGHPIPLGGIAARRSLGRELLRRIDSCIRASVRLAFADPGQSRLYCKQHAQELDDQVIASHIGLYVNHFSEELGAEGQAAIREFLRRGRQAEILPAGEEEIFLS
ncbi:MAG: 1,4-dihydroxy-6-naphthoate synthase [Deltaproteobacteria bacterium]|nr:1,4-dihydroxy-6-naphthoate synthase [Deltaproteobacteria bacterium]